MFQKHKKIFAYIVAFPKDYSIKGIFRIILIISEINTAKMKRHKYFNNNFENNIN